MTYRRNTMQLPHRVSLNIFAHYRDWQRLDDAAFLAETALEAALDKYCEGAGRAPDPEEIALARRLRQMASTHFQFMQGTVRQIQASLKEL